MIFKTGTKSFQCSECNSEYVQKMGLRRHIDQKHSLKPKFACPTCGKSLGGKLELERHIATHDSNNYFKHACSICGKLSKTADSSVKHVKFNHTKERNVKCDLCPKMFLWESAKRKHELYAHTEHNLENNHNCNICSRKFKNEHTLKSHMEVHTGGKRYKCDFCGKLFGQSHQKKTHEEYVHLIGSERPYK